MSDSGSLEPVVCRMVGASDQIWNSKLPQAASSNILKFHDMWFTRIPKFKLLHGNEKIIHYDDNNSKTTKMATS